MEIELPFHPVTAGVERTRIAPRLIRCFTNVPLGLSTTNSVLCRYLNTEGFIGGKISGSGHTIQELYIHIWQWGALFSTRLLRSFRFRRLQQAVQSKLHPSQVPFPNTSGRGKLLPMPGAGWRDVIRGCAHNEQNRHARMIMARYRSAGEKASFPGCKSSAVEYGSIRPLQPSHQPASRLSYGASPGPAYIA